MVMIEEGKVDKVFVIRLDDGEKLMATLGDILDKYEIKSGFMTLIGAVRNLEIKTPDPSTKEHYRHTIVDNMEILANGNISLDKSEIFIHLHSATGKRGGDALVGHVVEAEVHDFVEILIMPFRSVKLQRIKDAKSGLQMLVAHRIEG